MRKAGIILLALLLLIVGGYLFLRYRVLHSKKFVPQKSIARSPLDLRPAIAARIKQMVFDASNGLYKLSLDDINPDISSSTVDIVNARVTIDSNRMRELDRQQLLPPELYQFSFKKLHIDGLELSELIKKKDITLERITIDGPRFTVYHNMRGHKAGHIPTDSTSLYTRLARRMGMFVVKEVVLSDGTYMSVDQGKERQAIRLKDITALIKDIHIDSATRQNSNRFLFAADAEISCSGIQRRTSDSMYMFKTGKFFLQAGSRQLTIRDAALSPRGDRDFFRRHHQYRIDRFDISVPRIVLRQVDWNALFIDGKLTCNTADLYNVRFSDFVNDGMPLRPANKPKNFPYQLFHELPVRININQANFHNLNIAYTEYFPPSAREGTIYFNNATAKITNLINDPQHIGRNMWCRVHSRSLFMNHTPMEMNFGFDLNRYREGHFTADIRAGATEGSGLNPVTEPLALFNVKKGSLDSLTVHLDGNNNSVTGDISMLYHDLHITPLKKLDDGENTLKKRHISSLIANLFVIRNNNPDNRGVRRPHVTVSRDNIASFFHFGWVAIRQGVFETVGLPADFAPK